MKGEKTVKKIIAFVMILALLCAMLTSCSEAESLLRKADNFLEDEPYTMTFEVDFESDDPKLNKAFSDFDMEIPVTVDGKNISMDMSMRYDGYNANAKIIVYDMVMYCDITAGRQNAKVKADISDSQYDTLMIDSGAQMPLEIDDFADITASLKIGERVVQVPLTQENPSGGQEIYFNVPETGGSLIYTVIAKICKGTAQERTLTYSNASSPLALLPAKWAKVVIKSNHNGIIGGPDISFDDDLGEDSSIVVIDPDSGTEFIEGDMNLPKIYVDTSIADATVIDCELDVN
jgi:hypothetical protein